MTAPNAENPAAAQPFEIDNALNNAKFLKFLAAHPDHANIDMKDAAAIEKWHKAFEKKASVEGYLKQLFKNDISKRFKTELSNKELESIEAEMSRIALEKPEEVEAIENKIKAFEESKKTFTEMHEAASKLPTADEMRQRIENAKKQIETLETAGAAMGIDGKTMLYFKMMSVGVRWMFKDTGLVDKLEYFNDLDDVNTKREALKDVAKTFGEKNVDTGFTAHNIQQTLKKEEQALATLTNLEDMKTKAADIAQRVYGELLGGLTASDELVNTVRDRVADELDALLSGKDLKSSVKGYERVVELEKMNADHAGIEPLDKVDEWKDAFDTNIDEAIAGIIHNAIDKLKITDNSFANLEKALDEVLKSQKLGSKEGDDAKKMIVDNLTEQRDALDMKKDDSKAKQLLMNRLIAKLSK